MVFIPVSNPEEQMQFTILNKKGMRWGLSLHTHESDQYGSA